MRIAAWLVFYFVGSVVAEFVFEFTEALNAEVEQKTPAVAWFVLLGVVGGIATGGLVPDRLLPPGPFTGTSVLILPVVLAAGMAMVGGARGAARSHLASWYGGAALGLGLAVGRLIGLAFVAEVRSV